MRKVDLKDWNLFSERANSNNFRNADETKLLKIAGKNFAFKLEELENEKKISNEVYDMGIVTPQIFEIVEVDGKYGLISENIKDKVSISRGVSQDISKIEYYAKMLGLYLKDFHSKKCTSSHFTKYVDDINDFLKTSSIFNEEQRALILKLSDMVKDDEYCVHGDCNASNFIVAHDIVYAIDLSFFTKGNPLLDIGSLYIFSCRMPREIITRMFHVEPPVMIDFWNRLVPYYLGTNDEEKIKEFNEKIEAYGFLGLAKHASHLDDPWVYVEVMKNDFEKAFEWVKKA